MNKFEQIKITRFELFKKKKRKIYEIVFIFRNYKFLFYRNIYNNMYMY